MTSMPDPPPSASSKATCSAPRSVRLVLHRGRRRLALERRLAAAVRCAADALPGGFELAAREDADPPEAPVLSIEIGGRVVARYLASPDGPEEPPFRGLLEGLIRLSTSPASPTPGEEAPERLIVFIAPDCPRCPVAVRSALDLALDRTRMTVDIVDATLFPELAESIPVRSVPTLVADSGLTIVGMVSPLELEERLAAASGGRRDRVVLESLTASGRFADAGRLMAGDRGAEAFAELWLASTLESRIALLLAADEALAGSKGCLDPVARSLERGLLAEAAALRGDTADLLRRLALPSTRAALERCRDDADPDVAEAVADALAAIEDGERPA